MARVTFKGVQRWYAGTARPAVAGLDLEVDDGEFMVLVGPSGCGKSTTLRMLAGLEPVDAGAIFIDDRDVSDVAPKDRDIAMVFQNYALYPHMTVAENMGFALKLARMKPAERDRRVADAARMLGLTEYLDRRPRALSGGQRQRVAMGRAIVRDPAVFCMDEPLSNLDAKMRVQTRTDIARVQRDLGVTTVYVTHDQVEAMTMGDRVAVLHEGELQQVDEPLALYDRPANLFVAGFIGSPRMNLLPARVVDGGVALADAVLPVAAGTLAGRGVVTVGIRPEGLTLVPPGTPSAVAIETVLVEELGADTFVHGHLGIDGEQHLVIVRAPARASAGPGAVLHVRPEPGAVHMFDTVSGVRLSD